uniref:Uncharacterized protein n=1 Tax=Emaravirus camelliae TaxID=2843907 RepID=A0A8B0RFV1_9VIRU|nr:hypothetical protein [Emaravirus camelliae]
MEIAIRNEKDKILINEYKDTFYCLVEYCSVELYEDLLKCHSCLMKTAYYSLSSILDCDKETSSLNDSKNLELFNDIINWIFSSIDKDESLYKVFLKWITTFNIELNKNAIKITFHTTSFKYTSNLVPSLLPIE